MNLREEDNLSRIDKTSEFILSTKCPIFGSSTAVESIKILGHSFITTIVQILYQTANLENVIKVWTSNIYTRLCVNRDYVSYTSCTIEYMEISMTVLPLTVTYYRQEIELFY